MLFINIRTIFDPLLATGLQVLNFKWYVNTLVNGKYGTFNKLHKLANNTIK